VAPIGEIGAQLMRVGFHMPHTSVLPGDGQLRGGACPVGRPRRVGTAVPVRQGSSMLASVPAERGLRCILQADFVVIVTGGG
jgi:hypothetical protein